ncbi:MAG: cell surface protein SprA [Paludibacter sp.]|nr:cell surface protein SprA [Paludibacter sp.]
MVLHRKTIFLILFFLIVLGSVSGILNSAFEAEMLLLEPADTATVTGEKTENPVFDIKKTSQDDFEEISRKYPMDAPMPENVKSTVEYDVSSGNYVMRTRVGDNEIATPFTLNGKEYIDYSARNELNQYWKELNAKAEKNNEDKFSITDIKFDIGKADKIFGKGGVQIKTQGSAELIFGIKSNKLDNPALTERMRTNTMFDFDEKIQMNVTGSVGDKVNFNMNYNTESTFDFDQKMVKLNYKGNEDDIIRSIQAGNVSMQLNSSLISGSTALFGLRTDLQFGKLSVSAIASQQESETQTVSSKGGAQTTKFEVGIDEYDENRHFFIGHHFRKNYEPAMSRLPFISSGITINRIEVWITNKRANYDEARNIIAFMDLGENERIDNPHWQPTGSNPIPYNDANTLYQQVKNIAGVRDIKQTNAVLSQQFAGLGINGGEDYEKIESARRLQPSEYTFNAALGILSLRNTLNPDEVLGIAYEYTQGGNVYQVGEFSTDQVQAPEALIVKLIKGTAQSPQLAIWDLMMKNVYYLGAMQIQKEKFELNIVYRNDSIGTNLRYLTEGNIKNQLLLRVMNLDRLDSKQDNNPDGKFDYVEGYTALSSSGRIMFPVLEPFGSHLKKMIGNDQLAEKYIFQELYDSTQVVAEELSEKNKFIIEGEYKASSGSEIRLNAMNVPRGSVTVTAGGATLTENVDYIVDYTMGTVNIINQSIIESGTQVDVKLENQSMFSLQRKTMLGTHMEYQFSKDFSLGGTIMHLSEMPLTTKVNTGNEPIANTIWGLNTSWRGQSQWLTNMLDKLPFVDATAPSTLAINAEFAQLLPGHHKVVGNEGYAYLDDFESTKTSFDIHYPVNWYLASTPSKFTESTSNGIDYGKNRALMSWYYVDPVLNQNIPSTPPNLRNNLESQSNHYTRTVLIPELFPNRETPSTLTTRMTVMNLSYYPTERGPYNLDVTGTDATTGLLTSPEKRWGGIMRRLDVTDFETSNIEYIEFWMMDPFIYSDGTDKGGDLYFNLGDISEDILKDGKKFFEHGLPIDDDPTKTETTAWGVVPRSQSTVTAFDNTAGARQKQDVGLNGLSTEKEFMFPTYKNYVDSLKGKLSSGARQTMEADPFSPLNDPAGDNYRFYRDPEYDQQSADILTRYKRYNGTEGNSPDAVNSTQTYTTTATSLPDIEDINNDNTLNEYERYFQYHVQLRPGQMEVGRNYITDKITSNVKLENNNIEPVTWYQFKIPLREFDDKVGNIRNFKSIRFIRMFLTNFEKEKHLRFATLDLVRGEWRNYTKELYETGKTPVSDGKMDVQAVNIEENSEKKPVNYILPPGVTRQTDPGQPQVLQQNEQSMLMKLTDLAPGDARAVYKSTSYDMRQYKRMQMFVHAEQVIGDPTNLKDNELTCFIRLGSDMVNNYYEYEVPLTLTPHGVYSSSSITDRETVWHPDNLIDFAFEALTDIKLKRNKAKGISQNVSNLIPYTDFDPKNPRNRITVVGNPTIAEVENIMIGVRNRSNNIKSGEIWVNELRMSEFNEESGWAAMANVALGLSDIGSINFAGRMETAGYGSLESNVMERRNDDLYQMNFSTSLELGRFLPKKAMVQLPAYFSYSNETLSPKYDPLDQDIELERSLNNLDTEAERDSLLMISQTVQSSKNFTISSAKINIKSKKPQFYDPANVTFSYSYSETNQHSAEVEQNLIKQERGSINYSHSFSNTPFEPFKSVKAFDKPAFKLLKELNINYLPSSISFNTNMDRQYSQIKLRDFNTEASSGGDALDVTFSKDFMWNRQFDFKWDLTKSLRFSIQTATNANIEEPYYTPEFGKEYYEQWRDTVWSNIRKLGTPYTYQQVFNASWNVPINKIPLLDWITSLNTSYNGNYNWNRTARLKDMPDIGNIATSMRSWQVDGQLNFETLYNKFPYLKEVNTRFTGARKLPNPKFQPKTYNGIIKLEKGKTIPVKHMLGSQDFNLSATDKTGKKINLNYKVVDASSINISSLLDADSISLTLITRDPNVRTASQQVTDISTRILMSVRRASLTYRETNSLVLPGFLPNAAIFGQQSYGNGVYAPGFDFAFGLHNDKTIDNAISNEWLYMSDSIINPATTAVTSDFDFKATLEPIPGLKIDLNAKRYIASNTTIQYMFEGMPTTFNGSYNITQVALLTAFKPIANATNNYASETFSNFMANRQYFADKLNARYTGTKYPSTGFMSESSLAGTTFDPANGAFTKNSVEVLIPAFLSAYTGRDPSKTETTPFLSLLNILPNWRMSYDGLSRLQWVKDNFKSVSITHAYTCRYSIGSYTSYSTWVAMGDDDSALGYIRDVQSNAPIPSSPYEISSVSLTEQFSPLIGINAALKNSMTTKLEYKKQRSLALNLSSTQLIDAMTDEFVVGVGYVVKDFDVILKLKNNSQSRIKNDLKINADLSYKDIKSLLRKIDQDLTQASSGNKLLTLKIMADYVFSSKVNIQVFYDRQVSTPLISSTFPVSSTNFGVSFKFMLTR